MDGIIRWGAKELELVNESRINVSYTNSVVSCLMAYLYESCKLLLHNVHECQVDNKERHIVGYA